MQRRKLPIGIQTFRKVRESGCYYVDKTAYVERLVSGEGGDCYFLSRPRRFGKSLFLSTLKEVFEGSRELFAGLAIYDRWDWSVRYPVVRLSFGRGDYKDPGYLQQNLHGQMDSVQRRTGVAVDSPSASERFAYILEELHHQTARRVVVLVDEYDKPILDALTEPEVARANRDFLRGLYATVKDSDEHVRFVFLTGVSKFSKVSLFSGLNNLNDITLDPRYSSVCGYTDADLDTVFTPELDGLDRDRVREWYNGYSWLGDERVYNPFDILRLFDQRMFGAYWFETGTPKFLVDTLTERGVPSITLSGATASAELLSAFDVDHIGTEALLFQTGYLTITAREELGGLALYRLDYPNREVRQSLNGVLLRHLLQNSTHQTANSVRLQQLLHDGDIDGLRDLFHAFYASIPYEWYTNNDIARFEGYYASVFYSYFAALGLDITVEDSTNLGRIDMTVRCAGRVYIFEFTVVEFTPSDSALAQLRDRDYADKYRSTRWPVHLIGVVFSSKERNIVAFETATIQPSHSMRET
ncbi:MAG: ATP-binding protein [Acidimicrobiaceae bacterium]|nr:ATP-binding protein [Acidimicrobiaceae bacterium]